MRALVEIRGVHKSFGSIEVLRDISLDVAVGSVACLIGPSGSGKSTLLRCVNHLEKLTRGVIRVNGDIIGYRHEQGRLVELPERKVAAQRARIGMVFQRFNLFPNMTALDNVAVGPALVRREAKAQARARAEALLAQVGLGDRMHYYPSQLSGGQQQRVAIARSLAMQPELMLFDEPTSALDPELVGEVLQVIRQLAESGMTMIVVTHEMAFAREVASQVTFMDNGQIVETGPPAQVLGAPEKERTRKFLSSVF